MSGRYIQVPEDIEIRDYQSEERAPIAGGAWPFARFLTNIVLADPAIGSGFPAARACHEILEQFDGVPAGTWVNVSSDHHDRLKKAIDQPEGKGVSNLLLMQLVPFYQAITEALDADSYKKIAKPKNGQQKADKDAEAEARA